VETCICKDAEKKFREVWKNIYMSVWQKLLQNAKDKQALESVEEQFTLHNENYFQVYCACVDYKDKEEWKKELNINEEFEGDSYAFTYDFAERVLGAKKSWRVYEPLVDKHKMPNADYPDGCSMCGERHYLAIDWRNYKNIFGESDARHIRGNEKLCGVCLIKRFAVKYAFDDVKNVDLWHYPSTEEIAGIKFKQRLKNKLDEDIKKKLRELGDKLKDTPYYIKNPVVDMGDDLPNIDSELFRKEGWEGLFRNMKEVLEEDEVVEVKRILEELIEKLNSYNLKHRNPYFAVLVADGDSIGDWLGLESSIRKDPLNEDFHRKFSEILSEYARQIVSINTPKKVVYAGGDDILALLHPQDAVEFWKRCSEKFREKLRDLSKEDKEPSLSGGILITHAKMSLQKALLEAYSLERKAKEVKGKGAVAVGVLTRTGAMKSFVAKAKDVILFEKLVELFRKKKIGTGIVRDMRFFEEKFLTQAQGGFEKHREEILLSLLKKSFKRRLSTEVSEKEKEELLELLKEFFIASKDYREGGDSFRYALSNLAGLVYVARAVGTLEGEE
jgi:CRISPR-associated protein Cmr2